MDRCTSGGPESHPSGPPTFQFRTQPFDHQREAWERTRELLTHAIFWEQGTGKTKLAIDTIASLAVEGKIDAVLIVAPEGVHTNWVVEELPTHWPECAPEPRPWVYMTKRASTKWHERGSKKMATQEHRFPILAMTYGAIMTKKGGKLAANFLRRRRVFYVLDESSRIKTPSAKRTIRIIASGRHADYKRILTGTPITNSPFDCYTQFRFLDENFWKDRGFASFEAFKTHFGVWGTMTRTFWDEKQGKTVTREIPDLIHHRNLDQLGAMVQEASSRVLKEDVLDLPPKLYTKRYFEMSAEQRRLYDELKEECMTFLDGEMITAQLIITRLLRFQQILCGYLPSDDGEYVHDLGENPLLRLFLDSLEDVQGDQAIIWARFRRDVDLICEALGGRAARYDGRLGPEDRQAELRRFRAGDAQFFVSNPAVGGTGLTLVEAKQVLYYSNSFNLEDRLQSEDRAHRIGQDRSVLYTDFSARGTVLEHIIRALRRKFNVAAEINGDDLRAWI